MRKLFKLPINSSAQSHCRQRAPVGNALSSSGTSQLGMFDIQATTKSKYYDHIVLLYLESRRCRYGSEKPVNDQSYGLLDRYGITIL